MVFINKIQKKYFIIINKQYVYGIKIHKLINTKQCLSINLVFGSLMVYG